MAINDQNSDIPPINFFETGSATIEDIKASLFRDYIVGLRGSYFAIEKSLTIPVNYLNDFYLARYTMKI